MLGPYDTDDDQGLNTTLVVERGLRRRSGRQWWQSNRIVRWWRRTARCRLVLRHAGRSLREQRVKAHAPKDDSIDCTRASWPRSQYAKRR